MGDGKHGFTLAKVSSNQNPIQSLQLKYKELETSFKTWVSQQSIPVEAAIVTTTGAIQGAAIGGLMGTFTGDMATPLSPPPQASLNPQAMASFKQAQALAGGPLAQARNFAVMTGANAGIACVMRRVRGKDDVQSSPHVMHEALISTVRSVICSMVAAFGSGALFSLVSGVGGPNPAANALSSGFFFALVQGGLYQLGQKFSQPPGEDLHYARTRSMLSKLGIPNYEKNFKKGLLNDNTLPLLTDSALRDVKIPPGPRLLILDHVQRDPEMRAKSGHRG
ncbi:Chloroplastic import inner membrane translocase subunit HP30-2 [Linum perenne]